jgi:pheromone shutdown protein TraB
MVEERDALLTDAIAHIHTQRCHEAIEVAVVYGAAHFPAVVRTLTGRLGYRPQRDAEWLTAIDF